jgi:hypothetical protein
MNATATMTPAEAQHMRALQRANEVRLARAELKRSVSEGIIEVAEVILNCPWEAESMAVADLLTSQRRWGQTRVRRFLALIPISETKTIGSMTDRQRHELARSLSVAHGNVGRAPQRASVSTASAVRLPAAYAG